MSVKVSFMTRPPFLRRMECTLPVEFEAALVSGLACTLWRRCNSLAPAMKPAATCPLFLPYCPCSQSYPGSPRKWRLRTKVFFLKKYHSSHLRRSRLFPHTILSVDHLVLFILRCDTSSANIIKGEPENLENRG
jgi:hypothetical protein